MGDEPGGVVTRGEQWELDALRGRAYAQDADIFEDAAAVARLRELEDRLRAEHFAAPGEWTVEFSLAMLRARSLPAARPAGPEPLSHPLHDPLTPLGRRTAGRSSRPTWLRWHEALVAGTAAISVLLAAWAWTDADGDARVAVDAVEVAAAADPDQTSYAELYELHVESLREDLLSGPGMEEISARMFRGLLRPQGVLYGRAVRRVHLGHRHRTRGVRHPSAGLGRFVRQPAGERAVRALHAHRRAQSRRRAHSARRELT